MVVLLERYLFTPVLDHRIRWIQKLQVVPANVCIIQFKLVCFVKYSSSFIQSFCSALLCLRKIIYTFLVLTRTVLIVFDICILFGRGGGGGTLTSLGKYVFFMIITSEFYLYTPLF